MRRCLIVLAACGAPPIAPSRAPSIAPSSCADAAAILRGPLADESSGPSREAAIRDACTHSRWPLDTLDCITGTFTPDACLADLPPRAHAAYEQALLDWRADHPDAERVPDEPAAPDLALAPDCAQAAASLAGPLMPSHRDADFATALRVSAIRRACETDAWPPAARACTGADAVCDALPPLAADHLAAALAAANQRLDALDRSASPSCDRVAQRHYGARPNPAASIRAMRDACTTERWSPTVRACIATFDDDSCFIDALPWPFPALAVFSPTGIPACDDYARAVTRLASCKSLDAARRREFLESLGAVRESIAAPPADPQLVAEACTSARAALDAAAPALGCGP